MHVLSIRRTTGFLFLVVLAGITLSPFSFGDELQLSVEGDSLDRTVIDLAVDDFEKETQIVRGKEYLSVALEHEGFIKMDQVGHPQLPSICRSIMIPDTARMEVGVLESEYYDIENVDLLSYRGPILRCVDPSTVGYTFNEVYRTDAWFPGDLAKLRDPYILHDVRGTVVELYPLQYNPVKKILRVHTRMRVEVIGVGSNGQNILNRSLVPNRPDRTFHALYQSQFINSSSGRTEPPTEDGDLLVICHGPFMAAMQPYVDWKNSIGIPTTIVDVATIGNNATAIKNYIKNLYNTTNLAYVQLVGDANEVKSGSYYGDLSDPFYSTITTDWYPDIFVGRFSAQTVAHVETQVQRTLDYEQQGHDLLMGGWNTWGMGVASNQGTGVGHYGESDDQHMDLIRNELLGYGFQKVDRIYDYFGTKSMVTNGLHEGRRVVNYCGHGSSTSWGSTGYSSSDVNMLKNVDMLPFISSVACVNGAFGSTCFAEAWLRATYNGEPTGAVACYMSTVNQSWAPPMYGQGNHAKNNQLGAAERFWTETNWSIAGLWYGGSCTMMDITGSSGRDMFMTWIVFGDASLRTIGTAVEPTLKADGSEVPMDNPVNINFTVCPGPDFANDHYILLCGLTGTDPGTVLPGGLQVPLNFDVFTYLAISMANSAIFQNFYGTLDGAGEAVATFSTQGVTPLESGLNGTKIYFCAVTWPSSGTHEFATNVRVLTIVR